MKLEIVFIADDFGLNPDANRAIVQAHRDGALHGASLMMGQPGTDDAVALARANPTLQIGWHLHLCHSQPVTCAAWPWGDSPARAGWAMGLSAAARTLMRREVAAQWEMFRATGLPCAFVNAHHHIYAHPAVYAVVREVLPRDFGGWIRLGSPRYFSRTAATPLKEAVGGAISARWRRGCPWRSNTTLWGMDRTFRMRAEEVRATIATLPPSGLHEFMFHPRHMMNDQDLATLLELKSA